jgi:hypothetical protein
MITMPVYMIWIHSSFDISSTEYKSDWGRWDLLCTFILMILMFVLWTWSIIWWNLIRTASVQAGWKKIREGDIQETGKLSENMSITIVWSVIPYSGRRWSEIEESWRRRESDSWGGKSLLRSKYDEIRHCCHSLSQTWGAPRVSTL